MCRLNGTLLFFSRYIASSIRYTLAVRLLVPCFVLSCLILFFIPLRFDCVLVEVVAAVACNRITEHKHVLCNVYAAPAVPVKFSQRYPFITCAPVEWRTRRAIPTIPAACNRHDTLLYFTVFDDGKIYSRKFRRTVSRKCVNDVVRSMMGGNMFRNIRGCPFRIGKREARICILYFVY